MPHLSFRTQTHDWKQRSQKGTTSNVTNSDILTLTTEYERVNNTHDCDRCKSTSIRTLNLSEFCSVRGSTGTHSRLSQMET